MSMPTKDGTFGALYIGQSFSLILYGCAMHQVYQYFRMYPQDKRFIKTWVIAVMLLETLGSAFMFHTCYFFLITNESNLEGLAKDIWSYRLSPVTCIGAVALTQGFYARRVFYLGRQFKWIVAVAALLIFIEMGLAIAISVITFILASVDKWARFAWLVAALFGFALAADVLLTGTLIYVLLKGRTGFKSTDSLLDTLIIYSVNTGLITSVFGILAFVLSLANSSELFYSAFSIMGAKMYSNSFLAMLNARKSLGGRTGLVDDFETRGTELDSFPKRMRNDFLVTPRTQGTTAVSVDIKGSGTLGIGSGRLDTGDIEGHHVHDGSKGSQLIMDHQH